MKGIKFYFSIVFFFVSLISSAQTRTTAITLNPNGFLLSTETMAQYNVSGGLGIRIVQFPSNVGFYWGADLTLGMTFMRGLTNSEWLNIYPHTRGLFFVSFQAPFGYGWADKIGNSLDFFIGGGPTLRARFQDVMLEFGTFAEAGFTTGRDKKVGLFLGARYSFYPLIFAVIPLDRFDFTESELALFFGIKWDRIRPVN